MLIAVGGGLFALSAAGVFDHAQPEPHPSALAVPSTSEPPSTPAQPSTSAQPSPHRTPSSPARPVAVHRYVFPVEGCGANASQSHHDYPASDIFTDKGCLFVAPIDGRVDEVTWVDRWDPKTNRGSERGGLSVSVVGVDGVRYYGSHLSSVQPGIVPGVRVRAGQTLGHTGKTGSARGTAPHLHFGISWPTAPNTWWIRRGIVAPQAFLNSWHHGGQLSPVGLVITTHEKYGAENGCRVYC